MTPQRWISLKSLFEQASELDNAGRTRLINEIRENDPELADDLGSLFSGADQRFDLTAPLSNRGCGTVLPARVLQSGDKLDGRFRIEEFVGAGGMGEVYRAFDEGSREQVALKTLRREYLDQPEFPRRLLREMSLARRVQHPNICRVYDVQRATMPDGTSVMFLIMEFIEGETLQSRIARGPLPIFEARAIAFQIIDGLAAAHDAGIIHRDLKSGNVMLSPDGVRAAITDFGLARQEQVDVTQTQTRSLFGAGAIVGTAQYMAPEQFQGKAIAPAADIHALGVILFEMVTGRYPFEGETPLAIALRRMSESAPSPRSLVKNLDRDWERATLACLEADPLRRPRTAAAVLAILKGTAPRQVSRRTVVWTSGITVAAGITAALGVVLRPRPPISPEAERHYKIGEEFVRRRTAGDLKNAVEEYDAAVRIQADYADAWAGLAEAWGATASFAMEGTSAALAKSRTAAEKAVALAPDSPRAIGILGYCISMDLRQWKNAEGYFTRAVQLDPRRSELRLWYGAFLGKAGRSSEAIVQLLAGLKDAPTSVALNQQLASEYLRSGQFEKSLELARELIRLQPYQNLGYLASARALEFLERFDEGLAACDLAERYAPGLVVDAYRASILAARGDRSQALKIAARLKAEWVERRFEAGLLAKVYARAGDYRSAIEVLKEGASRNEPSLLSNILNPVFRPLFDSPDFIELARSLGLDEAVLKAYK